MSLLWIVLTTKYQSGIFEEIDHMRIGIIRPKTNKKDLFLQLSLKPFEQILK